MKIYTFPKSRSLRAIWTLEELGLRYQSERVDLLSPVNNTSPHPLHKVPVLEEGEFMLFETAAICKYLCSKTTPTDFYPVEPQARAVTEQWLSFALTELEAPVWARLKHRLLLPPAERQETIAEAALQEASRAISVLEKQQIKRWITGERFTLADIFISHNLMWARIVGVSLSNTLNEYVDRCFSRDACVDALRVNNE